ncbi:MAG: class I SAM-dependent methyltransferase [Deltaproteobacteria bacterium]|nr:class I SAM-dependent methyltransferase [Deltaproteobacteria bacterium]
MSDRSSEACSAALLKAGVPPAGLLVDYMVQLLDWNEKINVTGAKNPEELAMKHVADVWGAAQALGGVSGEVADVGSGGGIPGIILAILSPDSRVTLVERRQKKAAVLSSIVSKMGLDRRVRVVAKSFEEIKTFPRETEYWFRGFLPGPKLATYLSESFPKGDIGQLILMKGPAWPDEKLETMGTPRVRQIWLDRFGGAAEIPYTLPAGAGERLLVVV